MITNGILEYYSAPSWPAQEILRYMWNIWRALVVVRAMQADPLLLCRLSESGLDQPQESLQCEVKLVNMRHLLSSK